MDWSTDENLYSRFKMWKQRCEMLFTGLMAKIDEEIQGKHLLYWAGEHGLELFNSWGLSADEQKKLENYRKKFENYVKPHSHEQCPARNAMCHYCQKVGNLAKVCFSKLKKKDVHEIEATSNNNAIPESEPTQSLDDYVFLGLI